MTRSYEITAEIINYAELHCSSRYRRKSRRFDDRYFLQSSRIISHDTGHTHLLESVVELLIVVQNPNVDLREAAYDRGVRLACLPEYRAVASA